MQLILDPGVVSPGVALYNSRGELVASGRVSIKKVDACLGQRWHEAARQIADFCRGTSEIVDTVVYEKPKIYTWNKSKGDPDDLLGLCAIGAAVAAYVGHCRVFTYEPSEWVGQVSKVCSSCNGKAKKKCQVCKGSAWETPRGRLIRGRLTPAELLIAHDQNDEIDAIGLGLHHLGRLRPRRVYSNGR